MKKGLFTAAVIAAMMMTQPVMAQEVVEQTGEVVQQTEEDVSEPDMAADYQMETDLAAEIMYLVQIIMKRQLLVLIQRARKATKTQKKAIKNLRLKPDGRQKKARPIIMMKRGISPSVRRR